MSVLVTTRKTGSGIVEYVLMEGDRLIKVLNHHSTVEDAYQLWLKKFNEEFDWRPSGHQNVECYADDWDQSLSDQRFRLYQRDKQRAQEMVALLEPHRNAPFVEAEWQIEERRRKERETAEAIKLVCKVKEEPGTRREAPQRKPGRNSERKAALLRALDNLIGLKSLKQDVRKTISQITLTQKRKQAGLKNPDLSLHMVFYGNPGTGKTTVARLLAKIYFELGILSKGHLTEVDRSGLVAGYLGQTALKVRDVVNQALGGVLFIDEAYSLASDAEDEYGAEAIATLLTLMENHRDKLVVIVAGYPLEMSKFLRANPGLQSRFNKYLTFEDYTSEELTTIFRRFCTDEDYNLLPDAESTVRAVFQLACEAKDSRFGNGRLARNCFDHAVLNLADRLATEGGDDKESLMQIKVEDIPSFEVLRPSFYSNPLDQ